MKVTVYKLGKSSVFSLPKEILKEVDNLKVIVNRQTLNCSKSKRGTKVKIFVKDIEPGQYEAKIIGNRIVMKKETVNQVVATS
jgi:hypothetical protein